MKFILEYPILYPIYHYKMEDIILKLLQFIYDLRIISLYTRRIIYIGYYGYIFRKLICT